MRALERELHYARRATLWENIHGPAKAAGARAANAKLGRGNKDVTLNSSVTFTEETAKTTGKGVSTVRRGVA